MSVKVRPPLTNHLQDPGSHCMLVGAFRASWGVKDIDRLYNSPIGCCFHVLLIMSRHLRDSVLHYLTMLDENDVIFGSGEKLRASLERIIENIRKNIKAVLVISSCVAEVTSTSTETIISSVLQKTKRDVKVIPVKTAGFIGDHVAGYNEALLGLLSAFVQKSDGVLPSTVNLLGFVEDEVSTLGDVAEIERLLNALGISVNTKLCVETSTEQIKNLTKAEANIVVHREYGLKAAQYLKEHYDMPYFTLLPPFGYEGTREWLLNVGKYFGKEAEAESLLKREEPKIYKRLCRAETYLAGKKVAIKADPTMAVGLTRMCAELWMKPVIVSFNSENEDMLKELEKIADIYDVDIEFLSVNRIDFKHYVKKIKPKIVFGSQYEHEIAYEANAYFFPIAYPTTQLVRAFDAPLMGYTGVLYVAHHIGSEMLKQVLFDEFVYGKYLLEREYGFKLKEPS